MLLVIHDSWCLQFVTDCLVVSNHGESGSKILVRKQVLGAIHHKRGWTTGDSIGSTLITWDKSLGNIFATENPTLTCWLKLPPENSEGGCHWPLHLVELLQDIGERINLLKWNPTISRIPSLRWVYKALSSSTNNHLLEIFPGACCFQTPIANHA